MKRRSNQTNIREKRWKNNFTRFRLFLKKSIIASTVSIVVLFIAISSAVIILERFNTQDSISTSSESTKELQSIEILENEKDNINKSENSENKTKYLDLSPEIVLEGDEIVKVDCFENYVEPGFYADDNEDGNLSNSVNITTEKINDYDYQIYYEVKDSAGNVTQKTREVQIVVGTVCLTFDDGPSLEVTPQILDILKEKEVNATFFVIGFDENNDKEKVELLKRESNEGNVIGLHGMVHTYNIYSDIDTLMNNFYQIENLVINITGTSSKLIRFPGGTSNTISQEYCEGIMTQAVQRTIDEGYVYVDWNVDSEDASSNNVPAEDIYNNVVSNLKPGRVNVVLMHDSSTKQTTVDALSGIIDYCRSNGYDIEPLSTDMSIKSSQHHPKN